MTKEKGIKIESILDEMHNDVRNGDADALAVFGEMRRLEKTIKYISDLILPEAISEFEKYGEKTVKLSGFEFAKTQSGRYKFTHPRLEEIESEAKSIQKKMQAAYNLGINVVDEDTGESYPPAEYTPSKISLSVKLK